MQAGPSNLPNSDEITAEQLMKTVKSVMNKIIDFNKELAEFINDQKKMARKMWNNVIRYNILEDGPPSEFPIVPKEELLCELIATIQDQASKIYSSLIAIKESFDKLPQLNSVLQQQSNEMDWNPGSNFEVKGGINFRQPSEYLEAICDILYQYDIAITCMFHYYNALQIKDPNSYENLMNSFIISSELSDFVNEFKINALMLK